MKKRNKEFEDNCKELVECLAEAMTIAVAQSVKNLEEYIKKNQAEEELPKNEL